MRIDPRFLVESGPEIFTGSELLLKGCLETPGGVALLTGYPGSPIAGFFDSCGEIGPLLHEHGVAAKMANNEALGVAMVNGAQMVGVRAFCAFKSVGLHVASDALALGNLAGVPHPTGGAVICSGDDPWCESTQVPADSRFLFQTLRVPIVEPSSPQEVKDWIGLSFKLSEQANLYIGYLMTVVLADGGGTVECKPNQWPKVSHNAKVSVDTANIPFEKIVLLPPRTWRQELSMDGRFEKLLAAAKELGLNRVVYGPASGKVPVGIVASGPAYAMLVDALRELDLLGKVPILKLGISYPVDMSLVDELAQRCERIVVIEERRSFIEQQIAEHLPQIRQNHPDSPLGRVELWGKYFPNDQEGIPHTRGLHTSLLIERLATLFRSIPASASILNQSRMDQELATMTQASSVTLTVPVRTPAFCPGCPHRDSSSALLEVRKNLANPEYMQKHYGRPSVDLLAHGDTGCYTMLMFEPNKALMHNYSGMGLGGGTGAGADPFITNKQIVFMGDGTFFHSGKLAIANAIVQNQDITFIILENKTTAMTGHQPNPTLDHDITGERILAHDIEKIVRTLVPDAAGPLGKISKDGKNTHRPRVLRISPAQREHYMDTLERTILEDGVKVVIADKECGITFHRRKRREELSEKKKVGFVKEKTFMNVTEEVCEYCLECTNQTGCPGLKIEDTDYGKKIQTDFSTCVNDGACARIDACPSFEQVTVTRTRPPRLPDEVVDLTGLPDPPPYKHSESWRCYLAGVGGMGIGVAQEIITRAGHKDGWHISFLDRKGLAIRNGGVFSQVLFTRQPHDGAPNMPWGKADLLLGVDVVEAARAINPQEILRVASPGHTSAVLNLSKTTTIMTLLGRDDFEPEELAGLIAKQCKPGHMFAFNVGDLCERLLDSKLYANIMMLGVAYQLGLFPVSYKSVTWAIRHAVGREFERNYRAFNIGRKIVLRPDLFGIASRKEIETPETAIARKAAMLKHTALVSTQRPAAYEQLAQQTLAEMAELDAQAKRDFVIRLYDAVQWGGMEYARAYSQRVLRTYRHDLPDKRYAVTKAVIWNLAKTMMIKDEIYVAMLYTNPEKYRRDRRHFNVNPANGDRISYQHLNRPEFVLGKWHVRFHFKARDWQLLMLRHMRWLRGLMPAWHSREKDFRQWYGQLVDSVNFQSPWEYDLWLEMLSCVEPVTGYREVRYPKMAAAQTKVAQLQQRLRDGEPANAGRTPRQVSLSEMVLETKP